MEKDYRGWCESLVALGEVEVVRLDDREGRPLVMEVCLAQRPVCGGCGGGVWVKEKRRVELVDQPTFWGRHTRLVWWKRRWQCPSSVCEVGSFTEQEGRIAPMRSRVTSRAGRVGDRAGRPPGADGG